MLKNNEIDIFYNEDKKLFSILYLQSLQLITYKIISSNSSSDTSKFIRMHYDHGGHEGVNYIIDTLKSEGQLSKYVITHILDDGPQLETQIYQILNSHNIMFKGISNDN